MWQPIETAPKLQRIDLWSEKCGRYPDAIWDVVAYGVLATDQDTYGWTDSNHHGSIEEGGPYTHWMPHPAPPGDTNA